MTLPRRVARRRLPPHRPARWPRVLAARGARVRVVDAQRRGRARRPTRARCRRASSCGSARTAPRSLDGVDLVVPSPGVPREAPLLARRVAARHPGRERDRARRARLLGVPIVAVTGTNGKSTTTTLVGLRARRARACAPFVGGNLGTPARRGGRPRRRRRGGRGVELPARVGRRFRPPSAACST